MVMDKVSMPVHPGNTGRATARGGMMTEMTEAERAAVEQCTDEVRSGEPLWLAYEDLVSVTRKRHGSDGPRAYDVARAMLEHVHRASGTDLRVDLDKLHHEALDECRRWGREDLHALVSDQFADRLKRAERSQQAAEAIAKQEDVVAQRRATRERG